MLNMKLPRVIAERTIYLSSSNRWAEFWPEPMEFVVDMLNNGLRTGHNSWAT